MHSIKLSQNFLVSEQAASRVIAAIDPRPGDNIFEVGPGRGALTDGILERIDSMSALELDVEAVTLLANRHKEKLRILQGDILQDDFSRYGDEIRVVGNLPYHISSPILFHVDWFRGKIKDAHFMLQKEVVQRLVACPSTSCYGRLSVMLQLGWRLNSLFDVPPNCFAPVPKVWSSFVRMIPKKEKLHIKGGLEYFKGLIALAFSQRRKMLRNSLRKIIDDSVFERSNIDPRSRAEDLSVEQFVKLANESFTSE